MKSFIIALQFLTRISIKPDLKVDSTSFAKSVRAYPLVGYFIGLILLTALLLLQTILKVPPITAVIFIIVLEIIITGGLHLDGLMDSADGLFSNRPQEQILEIMKDSRIGANAVLALFCLLALKIGLLLALPAEFYWIIPLMTLYSRFVTLDLVVHFPYGGKSGSLGGAVIAKGTKLDFYLGLLATMFCFGLNSFLASLFFSNSLSIILIFSSLALLLVGFLGRKLAKKAEEKLGGITGDIVGAIIEFVEVFFLMLAVLYQVFI